MMFFFCGERTFGIHNFYVFIHFGPQVPDVALFDTNFFADNKEENFKKKRKHKKNMTHKWKTRDNRRIIIFGNRMIQRWRQMRSAGSTILNFDILRQFLISLKKSTIQLSLFEKKKIYFYRHWIVRFQNFRFGKNQQENFNEKIKMKFNCFWLVDSFIIILWNDWVSSLRVWIVFFSLRKRKKKSN